MEQGACEGDLDLNLMKCNALFEAIYPQSISSKFQIFHELHSKTVIGLVLLVAITAVAPQKSI